MPAERRENLRVPDNRPITEIVAELPWASNVVNVNTTGILTIKPARAGLHGPRVVQVQIPIPEASDSIWAKGRVVFEAVNPYRVGAGIELVSMADRHRRLLADLVEYRRQQLIAHLRQQVQLRKQLGAQPTPFVAPPPERRTPILAGSDMGAQVPNHLGPGGGEVTPLVSTSLYKELGARPAHIMAPPPQMRTAGHKIRPKRPSARPQFMHLAY